MLGTTFNQSTPMNRKQKIVTVIALGLFLVSVLFAPWRVLKTTDSSRSYYRADLTSTYKEYYQSIIEQTRYQPVFIVPRADEQPRLLWQPLLCTWLAIGVGYGGLFLLLKTKPIKPKPLESKRLFEKN
jgi:hypothetical protein